MPYHIQHRIETLAELLVRGEENPSSTFTEMGMRFSTLSLEHMQKGELLHGVVAELLRRALCLRIGQGIKISPVERRDHGIAEIGEEIVGAQCSTPWERLK